MPEKRASGEHPFTGRYSRHGANRGCGMKGDIFNAAHGTISCECSCGCRNTDYDTGMFQNGTEAFLSGDLDRGGTVICEECFGGNRPDGGCHKTYMREWRRNPFPRFGLRPEWEWRRFKPFKMDESDDLPF